MATAATDSPEIFIVFDTETTGLDAKGGDELIEIGAVPIIDGELREDCAFQSLIDPDRPIPPDSTRVHGITDEMVRGKPRVEVVLPEFLRYCGGHPLVAQNASFDLGFLEAACARLEKDMPTGEVHDTLLLSRQVFPGARRHSLDDICYRLDIEVGTRHRSIDDVLYTAQAFLKLRERIAEKAAKRRT